MAPPNCSISLASCAITGDPHQPVSPTTLIHVVPDGGVVGGDDCGDSLTGVSTGGSGKIVTGGETGVGDDGVLLPPHQVAINAHHRTMAASKIRGRARMELHIKQRTSRC